MKKLKKALCALVTVTLGATLFTNIQYSKASTIEEKGVPIESTLIEGNSQWKYEDSNTDLYTLKFYEDSYDDTNWKEGKAPLGNPAGDSNSTFGQVANGTVINKQSQPNAIITYYFRKDFQVKNLDSIKELIATVGIDDGFVMYINGQEVNRSYMNEGQVTHNTNANYVNEPSSAEGTVTVDLSKYISLLVEGKNEIAVSVHNRDGNSSDIYFDMNLIAKNQVEGANPKQVNVHMGSDPSTEVNFTYTTQLEGLETKVVLNKVGDNNEIVCLGTSDIGSSDKSFHKIAVTGLEPNTEYEYTVGTDIYTYSGTFKTALESGSKEAFKFAYLADTQVSNATNAKALGATLAEVNKIDDLSFVYIAGDITDNSTNESQWENLFENDGAYPTGGQDMFGNNLLSVVQGNHDNNILNRHINAPAEVGNIVYSYDYGCATFIMLNLETARYDADARQKQKEYLETVVKDAKARGQWTIVGFHKSLYTGASHIVDGDIIEARKFWAPVFSELDIDVVLQGHDHVYSRGFVDSNGNNANPSINEEGKVENPSNAPLYMVGGHAGGLKWYSKKNYTVGDGDPLASGYSFLDVNSTDTGSDVKKEQVITEIEVTQAEFKINTYMFKYNTDTDTITTEKYLYDSMTMERAVVSSDIKGSSVGILEENSEIEYTVSLSDVKTSNAYEVEVEYDENVMEFLEVESLLEGTIFTTNENKDGKASIIIGTKELTTSKEGIDVAKFKFKLKSDIDVDSTEVKLIKANTTEAKVENNVVVDSKDKIGQINTGSTLTKIHSYKKASDINKDKVISLGDLSIALANYRKDTASCDINLDGIVDIQDYIMITSYLSA